MSNRQARREQQRTTRSQPSRAQRPKSSGPKGSGPDLFSPGFLIGGAVLVVALIAVLIGVMLFSGSDSDQELVDKLASSEATFPTDLVDGATVGKPDAPLKIEQYEDFQCPYCLRYTAEHETQIIEEYVKAGKVSITYRQFPILGNESLRAALASQCAADQDKFWPYHNKLYRVQAEAGQWSNEETNVGRFSDDKLKEYAGEVGLDTAAFNTCFDSQKHLSAIQESERTAKSLGITGTPAFVVNGRPLGSGAPSTYEDWKKILDELYNQATASPTATATGTASASPTSAAATPTPTKAP